MFCEKNKIDYRENISVARDCVIKAIEKIKQIPLNSCEYEDYYVDSCLNLLTDIRDLLI